MASFIKKLLDEGKEYIFYKSNEWLELRQEVMHDHHYECQECMKQGRYTRADCVHHVNEVRHRPDLALSRFYIDENGNRKENLMPLCNTCHNRIHDKCGGHEKKDKFKNVERW
ncbi:MAG: HNH endonuclease [Oscillospiraceae bacterium]|nr:HNH endonuclease [Oscillospiraceae bacterium]